jgi:hypothetical protein
MTRSLSLRPSRFSFAALALALALVLPSAVSAQAPLQQQMSPEEFKAAGLDKLTPEELAKLNAWLGNAIEAETQKAATRATEEVKKFGREPVQANLVGEFHGFGRGREYTLDNGQVWVQLSDTELLGVHLNNPPVRIRPTLVGNGAYMTVGNYNTSATVRRIK